MKNSVWHKTFCMILAVVMLFSIVPSVGATAAVKAATMPEDKLLISQTDYTIVKGVTESHLIINDASGNDQIKGYLTTVEPNAGVEFKASYSGYYTKGSTPESRAEAAKNLAFDMKATTKQAKDFEDATDRNVVWATNADYYSMQTGQCMGYLIMEGNVVQTGSGAKDEPYFAVLKDGTYAIRDYGTDCSDVVEAISGPYYLVQNSVTCQADNTDPTVAPRNSIGLKADGSVVLFLADGRQGVSTGMTLKEMGEMMQALGCVTAIYLDGGGSATIASKHEGSETLTIQNTPSDGKERTVASALMLVSTLDGTGEFDHAAISPNNEVFIANASVAFEANGVDVAGYPTKLPSDLTWQLTDSSFGTISNTGVFKSNGKCGTVSVNLMRGTKIVGTTSIEVQEPDELSFAAASLNLSFNTTSDLGLRVRWNSRDVNLANVVLTWSMTPMEGKTEAQIGTFNGNLFTTVKAKETLTATIAVSYKELNDEIKIEIGKMPQTLFDFEPDADGKLMKVGDYDWGDGGRTWGDESMTYNIIGWDPDTGTQANKTVTGPFAWDGWYIGDNGGSTQIPCSEILKNAGYSFYTWRNWRMKVSAMTGEIVSSDEGETRFGDYSLKLNYDFERMIEGGYNYNEYLHYTGEDIEIDGTPSGLGVWVYAPEGTANFWIWTNIGYYNADKDDYDYKMIHFTTQDGRSIQYNGIYWDGWMYCEADLRGLAQYVTPGHPLKITSGHELIQMTFIPGGSVNENGDKIPMGDFSNGSLYFDNFRFVYGDTVDDMEKPVIDSVKVNNIDLSEQGTTPLSTGMVNVNVTFHDPESDNASGIDTEKTAIYIDGIKQELESVSATNASVKKILTNGTHAIKTVLYDKFGNQTADTRYININDANNVFGTVRVIGEQTAQIGKPYSLKLVAENVGSPSSISLELALNDTFGEPTVTFADGCIGASSFDKGVLKITATANAPAVNIVATIDFNVSAALAQGSVMSYEVITGTFTEDETVLSFAQPKQTVGVSAPYILTADTMIINATGKFTVKTADGKAPGRIDVFAVKDGGEDELIGTTNAAGVLVTNRFCRTVGEAFTVYADKDGELSFRLSGKTSGIDNDDAAPTNIRLNAVKDAATTQSITWFATPNYTAQEAVVEFVEASAYDSGNYNFNTATGSSEVVSFAENTASLVNTVVLEELSIGTTYCYRVGDGATGHWSEVRRFTTADNSKITTFFVLGDAQLSGNPSADTEELQKMKDVSTAVKAANPDFGIQTGDYVDNAGSASAWNETLASFSENYTHLPLVQVLGNHEYSGNTTGSNASTIFDIPDKDYYSVEYNNVYIAVINCNAKLDDACKWLVEDAAKSTCMWKVLTLHQPPYYTNPNGSSDPFNKVIPAAAEAAGIDFVFSGHDHSFARTEPMKVGAIDKDNGVVYYICGDLGEKSRSTSYEAVDNPDFNFAVIDQSYEALYMIVKVQNEVMTVTAYNLDGTIIDTYTKTKLSDCEANGHQVVYDRSKNTLSCAKCDLEMTKYTGFATDKDTGKTMYFLADKFKTGWFTVDTDIYHFDAKGLMHTTKVMEDIPTSCSKQGHKTVVCECGEQYTLDYNLPTGHTYVEVKTEDGSIYYRCSVCGNISKYDIPFVDVEDSDWFAKAVNYCYEKDYFRGTSTYQFSPNTVITRKMLVTVLWRMQGAPATTTTATQFSDAPSDYSAEAVRWAAENEIVMGYDDGTFKPSNKVSRQEMVTIMYRYALFAKFEGTNKTTDYSSMFSDAGTVSSYAKEAMGWAIANKIISGVKTDDAVLLSPKGTTTRAQIATVIMRLMSAE